MTCEADATIEENARQKEWWMMRRQPWRWLEMRQSRRKTATRRRATRDWASVGNAIARQRWLRGALAPATEAEADGGAAVLGQEVGVVVAVSVVALVVAVAALVDEDDDEDVEEPGLESIFMARMRRVG
jgi:hypothetical protein